MRDKRKPPHGQIYGLIADENLSVIAKVIYAYLCFRSGSKNYCYPRIETICREIGIGRATFYRHINELEEAKILVREQRKGTSTCYFLNHPDLP